MAYKVKAEWPVKINLHPANEVEEVIQNLRMIFAVALGTVPMDRGFGMSREYVDKPLPVAQAMLVRDAQEAVTKGEPRARVLGVECETDNATGKLVPVVEVSINGA